MSEEVNPQAGETEEAQEASGQQQQNTGESEVEKLRKENASWRRKLRDLEAKVSGYEQERMSEGERLAAQAKAAQEAAQQAQAELRKARAEAAIAVEAAKHGIAPDLLAKLVEVEFDEAGQPANVGAAAARVLEQYPQLKPLPPGTNPTNPQRVGKLSLDDIKRMSAEQINARWDEVQAAMAAGG